MNELQILLKELKDNYDLSFPDMSGASLDDREEITHQLEELRDLCGNIIDELEDND